MPKRGNPYGIETKASDTIIANALAGGNPNGSTVGFQTVILNVTDSGTALGQRIGTKQTNKSLLLRMHFYNKLQSVDPATGGRIGPLVPSTARCILFWDKQAINVSESSSTGYPTATDLLAYPTGIPPVLVKPLFYPLNLNNADRFKVIRDWTFDLGGSDVTTTGAINTFAAQGTSSTKTIQEYIPLFNVESVFTDAGVGAPGVLRTNALFIMIIADNYTPLAGTQAQLVLSYEFHARLRFSD